MCDQKSTPSHLVVGEGSLAGVHYPLVVGDASKLPNAILGNEGRSLELVQQLLGTFALQGRGEGIRGTAGDTGYCETLEGTRGEREGGKERETQKFLNTCL